jgi:hypothetical protein
LLVTGENPHGHRCSEDQAEREIFGCDERIEDPWFIECPFCDEGCDECEEGNILFYRCPNHYLSGTEMEVIREWSTLKEHKTWPVLGGTDDQAAWFMDAVRFLDQEASAFKERQRERSKHG